MSRGRRKTGTCKDWEYGLITIQGYNVFFSGNENVLKLDRGVGCITGTIVKILNCLFFNE